MIPITLLVKGIKYRYLKWIRSEKGVDNEWVASTNLRTVMDFHGIFAKGYLSLSISNSCNDVENSRYVSKKLST
jgi:hypothetical protein